MPINMSIEYPKLQAENVKLKIINRSLLITLKDINERYIFPISLDNNNLIDRDAFKEKYYEILELLNRANKQVKQP